MVIFPDVCFLYLQINFKRLFKNIKKYKFVKMSILNIISYDKCKLLVIK